MAAAPSELRALFCEALDRPTPQEQADYLDRACQGRPALRARVEALLRAHGEASLFLQEPDGPVAARPVHAVPPADEEGPGGRVGPYKLLEPIGEGGMGVVWMAEQQEPVRRLVAIKVLKDRLGSKTVLARFEAERQALALMDHPHIAKVHDAGATEAGRPYFVMELVKGVPITRFCDAQRLTLRQRLELFVPVCQAIQHAHTKGIIHRDVKPSNVLVACYDGVPVPKVIDFGIAKAAGQRLTEQTLVTGFGQVLGTLEYMSPEQAEFNALDVDTRSDVYSLGVLLYELLTGGTPLGHERARETPLPELLRLIREEEAPKPSTRLSRSETLPCIAAARQSDPAQLNKLLRGELDWIVLKALEKDRTRRYETAAGLARDVERYLRDEPVEACPPSAGYRLRKFAWKHRRGLLTAAAFLGLLLAGGALVSWQAVREARAERDRVVQEAKRGEAVRATLDQARALREQARAERDPSKYAAAREQVQRALALVEGGLTDAALAAQVRQVHGEFDEEEQDRRFVAAIEAAFLAQSATRADQGRFARERSIPLFRDAFRAYGLSVGQGDPAAAAAFLRQRPTEVRQAAGTALDEWLEMAANPQFQVSEPDLDWLRGLAAAELDDGAMQETRVASQEPDPAKRRAALERLAAAVDVRQAPPNTLTRLARRLADAQAPGSAEELLRRAWQQYPADFWVNEELGRLLFDAEPSRWEESVRYRSAAVALRPESPGVLVNLGAALEKGGQRDEAIACFRKAIDLDPQYAQAHHNLGLSLRDKGQLDEAIACYRKAIEHDPKFTRAYNSLGYALMGKSQAGEADACFRKAIDLDPNYAPAHANLGAVLHEKGQVDEAMTRFRKALEHDPKYAPAHANLGALLQQKGQVDEAIACFLKAIEHDPKLAQAHFNLGTALAAKGQADEAIACYRKALEHDPKYATAHYNLGIALRDRGQVEEAIACFHQALEHNPKHSGAHVNLGNALLDKGQSDEAVACFLKALESDPKNAPAHYNLGVARVRKGQVDEAIACFRKAIEHDPKDAPAHRNLGALLNGKGQVDEAILCYRKALEHDPKYAEAHYNLGNALVRKGQMDEAIACYRKAVELDPEHGEAHCNLGHLLRERGDFRAALGSLRTGHELGSKRKDWRYPSALWVNQCEHLVQLDDRVTEIHVGKARPAGAAESLELAGFCLTWKRPAAAVRFFTEAFTANPKLAADPSATHRYLAAAAAARAAGGEGDEAARLGEEERARLRGQALEWLRAYLDEWTDLVKEGSPADRKMVKTALRTWQQDAALAGVRGEAIAKLPDGERAGWQQLWADAAALLTRATQTK